MAALEPQRLVLGAFLLDLERAQVVSRYRQTNPTLIRKVLFLLLFLRGLGRSPNGNGPLGPQLASVGRAPHGCLVCTDSQESNPDYFLIFLNILIPIFGLRKTCREVPFFVPGSPFFRAGKSLFSCREVPCLLSLFDTVLWNKFVKRAGKSPAKPFELNVLQIR